MLQRQSLKFIEDKGIYKSECSLENNTPEWKGQVTLDVRGHWFRIEGLKVELESAIDYYKLKGKDVTCS